MYKISTIFGAIIALTLRIRTASAQSTIVPDTTLATEASIVNSLDPNLPIDVINGGAIRGNNLFHSFSQFNGGANRGVYFFSPSANIANILARVTGGSRSEILGTLGTCGNSQPNLFLINPSGIIFGLNASLNVGKSFIATTADTIQFGSQGFFSATNPQAPPLLTVNPSALLFNQINNGTIVNQSQAPAGVSPTGQQVTGLRVRDGNNLLLVGGNINIDGGAIRAYGGNVELASLEKGSFIQLNVIDGKGGDITINAETLSLKNAIGIFSSTAGKGNAGNITLNASNSIFGENSRISSGVASNGQGNGGDIRIYTGSLLFFNGA